MASLPRKRILHILQVYIYHASAVRIIHDKRENEWQGERFEMLCSKGRMAERKLQLAATILGVYMLFLLTHATAA